jgi:hypothetical protein
LRLCLGFPNICFNLFGSVLPTTFPTTLEEVLSAILPPNPPATSKIISTNCYGKATQKRLTESTSNPNVVVIITNKKNTNSNYSNYQVREMQDKNGKASP